MKHVRRITKSVPAEAALWQDIVCVLTNALVSVLGLAGGSSPLLTYLDEKCDLPQANE